NGNEQLACQTVVENDLNVIVPESALRHDEKSVIVQAESFLDDQQHNVIKRTGHRFGVAVDIGTTTLVAELHGFHDPNAVWTVSRANPQRNYGDDVITRIQKVIEEPAFLAKLQQLIVGTVNEMLAELAAKAGIDVTGISLVSVAGNTVMEHLFLGLDPSPLGFAPFTAPVSEYPVCLGNDIGLKIAPDGIIETLPIFGGFVGGDIVAGVLATEIHRKSSEQYKKNRKDSSGTYSVTNKPCAFFLIDIGTNGELVLCYNDEIYTAATAAGPAFEGGRIEHGMLAVPGAIDRVELQTLQSEGTETGKLFVSTIGNVPPKGICGSGLIDAVSELLRCGLIKPNGQFNVKADSPFLRFWAMNNGKPSFVLASENVSATGEAILLTQRDIRQLQLATGAIRAGIILLLRQKNLQPEHIETFYVGGGFGSFIRPEAARRIGLLPREVPLERIRFCGNTSLAGARLSLLDSRYRDESLLLARHVHHLELASLPDFATAYADAMLFVP
ncbi:MAG: ASKHA domain-containing protein, partial [Planctomycetaceae bacterium]|nr:ASKHA domain-containing protein [Planctomycetaceae bacterium]